MPFSDQDPSEQVAGTWENSSPRLSFLFCKMGAMLLFWASQRVTKRKPVKTRLSAGRSSDNIEESPAPPFERPSHTPQPGVQKLPFVEHTNISLPTDALFYCY